MMPRLLSAAIAACCAGPLAAQQGGEAGDLVVHCGTLHVGDGHVLSPAFLLVHDGKIASVSSTAPQSSAPVVDASSKVVMPGLVAADSDLSGAADSDYNVTPDVLALDAFDFLKKQKDALEGGVTTAYLSPGRQRLVSGQGAVVKTAGASMARRVLRESACLRANMGEEATRAPRVFEPNPHPTSDDPLLPSRIQEPTARIAILGTLRDLFVQGTAALREPEPPLFGPGSPENRYDARPLGEVVSGKLTLRVRAFAAQDIRRALMLQRELGCKMVLEDPYEIESLADVAREQGVSATFRLPVAPGRASAGGEDRRDRRRPPSAEALRAAARAGIPLAVAPATGAPLRDLLMSVALAVGAGLDREEALETVCSGAARILGVADRVGTLEPGKDADFVVLSGDPLAVGTMVEATYVDGKKVYERESGDSLLAVRCGRILAGDGRSYAPGVLLVENGRIKAIGEDLPVPAGAEIVDLPDAVMTPGFLDAFSHLGLAGDGKGVPNGAADQKIAEAVSFDDPMFEPALAAGITTVLVSGKDQGLVSGRISALKTGARDQQSMVVRDIAGLRLVFDGVGADAGKPLRELLDRGKRYADAWAAYEKALADFKAGKAEKPPEQAPPPAQEQPREDPITGTWEGSMNIQGRFELHVTLHLKLEGTRVTGQVVMSARGQTGRPQDLQSGKFENGTLEIGFRGPGGTATLKARVSDDKLAGSVSMGPLGDQPFEAVRTSKDAAAPAASSPGGEDGGEPRKPNVDENLEPLRRAFENRATIVVRTAREPSIRTAIETLEKAKVPFALHGADNGVDDASVFGDRRPGIVLGPDVVREEDGKLVDAAAVFADRGHPVALCSGECAGARFLRVHAAYAVRYGMAPDAALAALTSATAKMFRIDDRVGTLEKGKDADFVVFSGNPFEPTSLVLLVACDGRIAVDRRKEAR
ncbi:MAG: hypothetical protein Fur0037_24810 [Planctomycetota bacterium]